MLLCFFVIKFVVLKIVIKIFAKKITKSMKFPFKVFYQDFVNEIVVVSPFFLIPTYYSLVRMGCS